MKKILVFLLLAAAALSAQEFGFGFDDDDTGSSGSNSIKVTINGEVSASMIGYTDDFSKGAAHIRLGDIFSGKLKFYASTSYAEGIINLNLKTKDFPIDIDEAYVRSFLGGVDITAGLRKITWGKADSFGPLDVINPLDTSELYPVMADQRNLLSLKIARPLVHASLRFGQFSKLEGVFVPNFEPHYLAQTGKWMDSRMEMLALAEVFAVTAGFEFNKPDTSTLNYAQAGIRYTTTAGSSDIGAQYYYGRLHQPSVRFQYNPFSLMSLLVVPENVSLLYNPYHQIGFDFAQVLFGLNIRAELAANITEDTKGNDGSIYNPSIAWSFGFDRDIVSGINLNLQVNESIRLMHNKLGSSNPISVLTGNFDIEGGQPLTATRLTAAISKTFFRDELELRTATVWGIEDKDCAVMPAIIRTKNDTRFALSGGFFIGNSGGQLGQYKDNNFLKVSMTYVF